MTARAVLLSGHLWLSFLLYGTAASGAALLGAPRWSNVERQGRPGRYDLIAAVTANDQRAVAQLLRDGAPLYVRDSNGYSAIDYAVERFRPAAMQSMLLAMTEEFALTPAERALREAILADDSTALPALLAPVGRPAMEWRSELGSLLLSLAALRGNVAVGTGLLTCRTRRRPDMEPWPCLPVNGSNASGYTALPLSIRFGTPAFTRLLIASGADVNLHTRSKYRSTPLMEASRDNNVAAATLLLQHGARVNARDVYGDHALNWGAYFGAAEFVRLLLAHGADCRVTGQSHGDTAVDIAKRQGHAAVVELLRRGCRSR